MKTGTMIHRYFLEPEDFFNLYVKSPDIDKRTKIYKEFVKENNKESHAHVFTDIRYKKDDNVLFSRTLLYTLKKQGYMNHQ